MRIERVFDYRADVSGTAEERLRHAKLTGAAKGLRGAVWQADGATAARHRDELPGVWQRIDAVIALLGDPFRVAPPLLRAPGESTEEGGDDEP